MTNEELAKLIKSGEVALQADLWEQVHRLVEMIIRKLMASSALYDQMITAGATLDDLTQEGYFAMLSAVEKYDPESGYKFCTYLNYPVKNAVFAAIGLRTRRDQRDPLNTTNTRSLDACLTGPKGDEAGTVADYIPDPRSDDEFDDVLDKMAQEQERVVLDECIAELPDRQADVIRRRYYEEQPSGDVCRKMGISASRVQQLESTALDSMRRMERLQKIADGIIERYTYKGGFRSFKERQTSSVELAVLKIEEAEERMAQYQRIDDEASKRAMRKKERDRWSELRGTDGIDQ